MVTTLWSEAITPGELVLMKVIVQRPDAREKNIVQTTFETLGKRILHLVICKQPCRKVTIYLRRFASGFYIDLGSVHNHELSNYA